LPASGALRLLYVAPPRGRKSVGGCGTLLSARAGEVAPGTRARLDRGPMGRGSSQSRRWACFDDNTYAVKHMNNPQVTQGATHLLATEFVAARVGGAMGAPVFPMAIVEVAPELVSGVTYEGRPEEQAPGRSFGSFIRAEEDVVDADVAPPQWRTTTSNRQRAAAVCIIHTLLILGDSPQFVVRTEDPYEFWSIDHGFFISGGGAWPPDLGDQPELTAIETGAFADLNLTDNELRTAAEPLVALSDEALPALIAPLPSEWCPSANLRARCLKFVIDRRSQIRDVLGIDSEEVTT
jgi:hypothetical protein